MTASRLPDAEPRPTPQQLAKARAEWPCEHETKCGRITLDPADESFFPPGTTHWTCEACLIVPRVAALLAEVTAPLTDELDDLKRGLAEQGFTFDGNIVDAALHFVDSLKADTQRLTVELENAKRAEADIGLALSAQTEQFQEHMQKWRALKDTSALFRARLNLKHSASHTDATQALCGAPPPYVAQVREETVAECANVAEAEGLVRMSTMTARTDRKRQRRAVRRTGEQIATAIRSLLSPPPAEEIPKS